MAQILAHLNTFLQFQQMLLNANLHLILEKKYLDFLQKDMTLNKVHLTPEVLQNIFLYRLVQQLVAVFVFFD